MKMIGTSHQLVPNKIDIKPPNKGAGTEASLNINILQQKIQEVIAIIGTNQTIETIKTKPHPNHLSQLLNGLKIKILELAMITIKNKHQAGLSVRKNLKEEAILNSNQGKINK